MKPITENLWKTYEAINEFTRFADTKATAILAANGVITGLIFTNIGTIQTVLLQRPIALVPLLMLAGFISISSGFSAYCIVPRLKMNRSNCPIFFCDIANFPSAEAYGKAIETEMDENKIGKHLSDQIWANSRIVTKKYNAMIVSTMVFVALLFSSLLFMLVASWR